MRTDVLTVRGITRRFGKKAVLAGVDLDVAAGTVTALLGRNGVGKSTLLRILVGFLPPTSGSARVLGLDPVRQGPKVRARVGFVPERLELPRWMTVGEHFRFLEPFYPTWSRAAEARLVDQLGLDPEAPIRTLSKGFRTKHLLAAALAHDPALLLMDEPFSGLDPVVRGEVMTTLLGHLRDEGRTVVLVSHSLGDVERVADRVVFMEGGRIGLSGDLEDVQREFVRIAVHLASPDAAFTPPGAPQVHREGAEVLLTYLHWDDAHDTALAADPAVASTRRLGRDLNDVFVAAVAPARQEETSCAAS